jgi:hypothetical protein
LRKAKEERRAAKERASEEKRAAKEKAKGERKAAKKNEEEAPPVERSEAEKEEGHWS